VAGADDLEAGHAEPTAYPILRPLATGASIGSLTRDARRRYGRPMSLPNFAAAALLLLAGCGGSNAPAATPPTSDSAPPVAADSASAATAASTAPTAPPPSSPNPAVALLAELPKPPAKPPSGAYPKPSTSYKDCGAKVGLTGTAQKDFDAIVAACGTPTGMLEYAAPSRGEFGGAHKEQVYTLTMYAGMCYRFIAAGDSSVGDLDVRVEKPDGALVAIDKTDQPVAIIDSADVWCATDDVDYVLKVDLDGPGKGSFVFGVWARPKK
jgi:hypothetical protein